MFDNIFLNVKINDTETILDNILNIDVNQKDSEGEALLHYSVRFSSFEVARLLLNHGAKVDISNSKGDTPLMIACKMGKENFVKLFLRFNASPNCTNGYGETALHMAVLNGNLTIIKLLLSVHANIYALTDSEQSIAHYGIRSGRIDVLKFIIDKCNVDINLQDARGNSLLHLATNGNNYDVIDFLLKRKASVHLKNKQKETPLFNAVINTSINIVDCLIENGALYDLTNMFDESIIDVAREDIKQYLLTLEYNQQYQKRITKYPLHIAVLEENIDKVKVLLEKYSVNVKDDYGKTPVDYAREIKNKDLCKLIASKK